MSDPLSPNALGFIRRHIHSVEQLEVLLLLRSTAPRAWSAPEVGTELRIDPVSAEARLQDLEGRGLVARDGQGGPFTYRPHHPEDVAGVTALADAYRQRRVTVITAIFERPRDAVTGFAEAFRLGKKRD